MSKYLLLVILSLSLSSCSLFRRTTSTASTEPVSGVTSVAKGDTLTVVIPDSLPHTQTSKTTILSQIFNGKKVKNRGTIIIQTGEKAVAAKVDKAKAPVAVSQEPATATIIDKPKNSAITSGDSAPASATQTTEQGFNWSWLLVIVLGAVLIYGYRKVMG